MLLDNMKISKITTTIEHAEWSRNLAALGLIPSLAT